MAGTVSDNSWQALPTESALLVYCVHIFINLRLPLRARCLLLAGRIQKHREDSSESKEELGRRLGVVVVRGDGAEEEGS